MHCHFAEDLRASRWFSGVPDPNFDEKQSPYVAQFGRKKSPKLENPTEIDESQIRPPMPLCMLFLLSRL
jgi:hypothetical protein